jgi:DNA-binding FrmR family transcriptional regulator
MYQCEIENKKLINRINRISGQVNSLKKRLESEIGENHDHQDPYEIIRQLTTIKGAVNGMINSYIEHFAKGHLVGGIRQAKDESSAMAQMDALMEIMKTFGK